MKQWNLSECCIHARNRSLFLNRILHEIEQRRSELFCQARDDKLKKTKRESKSKRYVLYVYCLSVEDDHTEANDDNNNNNDDDQIAASKIRWFKRRYRASSAATSWL